MKLPQTLLVGLGIVAVATIAVSTLPPLLLQTLSPQTDTEDDNGSTVDTGQTNPNTNPVRNAWEPSLPICEPASYPTDQLLIGGPPKGGPTLGWPLPQYYAFNATSFIILDFDHHRNLGAPNSSRYGVDLAVNAPAGINIAGFVPVLSPIDGTVIDVCNEEEGCGAMAPYGPYVRIRNARWLCFNTMNAWISNEDPNKVTTIPQCVPGPTETGGCQVTECTYGQTCADVFDPNSGYPANCTMPAMNTSEQCLCRNYADPLNPVVDLCQNFTPGDPNIRQLCQVLRPPDFPAYENCLNDEDAPPSVTDPIQESFARGEGGTLVRTKKVNYEIVLAHLTAGQVKLKPRGQDTFVDLTVGMEVHKGDQVGTIGTMEQQTTGDYVDSPMLHYEIWHNISKCKDSGSLNLVAENPEDYLGKPDDTGPAPGYPCCSSDFGGFIGPGQTGSGDCAAKGYGISLSYDAQGNFELIITIPAAGDYSVILHYTDGRKFEPIIWHSVKPWMVPATLHIRSGTTNTDGICCPPHGTLASIEILAFSGGPTSGNCSTYFDPPSPTPTPPPAPPPSGDCALPPTPQAQLCLEVPSVPGHDATSGKPQCVAGTGDQIEEITSSGGPATDNDFPTDEWITYPSHPANNNDYGGILGMNFLWVSSKGRPNRQQQIIVDLGRLNLTSWALVPHVDWRQISQNSVSAPDEGMQHVCQFIQTAKSAGKKVIVKVGSACLCDNNFPSTSEFTTETEWLIENIPVIAQCPGFNAADDIILLGNEPNIWNCDGSAGQCPSQTYAQNVAAIVNPLKQTHPNLQFSTTGLSPKGNYLQYYEEVLNELKTQGVTDKLTAIGYHGYDYKVLVQDATWKTLAQIMNTVGINKPIIGDEIAHHHCPGMGYDCYPSLPCDDESQYQSFKATFEAMAQYNSTNPAIPILASVAWIPFDDGNHIQAQCSDSADIDGFTLYCEPLLYTECSGIPLGANVTERPHIERKAYTLFYSG